MSYYGSEPPDDRYDIDATCSGCEQEECECCELCGGSPIYSPCSIACPNYRKPEVVMRHNPENNDSNDSEIPF